MLESFINDYELKKRLQVGISFKNKVLKPPYEEDNLKKALNHSPIFVENSFNQIAPLIRNVLDEKSY